jgi:hypothetical protein
MSRRLDDDDDDYNLETSQEKPIIRIRNVLWRTVERGGNPKHLGRASVYLPLEAIEILELQDRGDIVAFMMKKKTRNVTITNYAGSQPSSIYKMENDPEILLNRLLFQVISLKSKKSEISEKWEEHQIDDREYIQETKKINRQLDDIKENVRNNLDKSFRGNSDPLNFMQYKLKSFYDEYASSFISYTEDLVSKIHSLQRSINAIDSAHSKGLFTESEYKHEKEELESVFSFLTDVSGKAINTLTRLVP